MPTTLVYLTTPGTSTWTVPANWTSAAFETIGGGGSSGVPESTGAGGGGYQNSGLLTVTSGTVCAYSVGAGGVGTATTTGNNGGNSWIALNNTASSITSSGVVSGAYGGQGAQAITGSNGNFSANGGGGASVSSLDPSNANSGITFSNNNLTVQGNSGGYLNVLSTTSKTSGKLYFEVTVNSNGGTVNIGGALGVGVARSLPPANDVIGQQTSIGFDNYNATYYFNSGSGGIGSGGSAYCPVSDTFGVAIDFTNHNIWVYLPSSGLWNGEAGDNPATNTGGLNDSTFFNGGLTTGLFGSPLFAGVSVYDLSEVTINFGGNTFAYAIPSGFTSWDGTTTYIGGSGSGSVNTFGAVHQLSGGGGAAGPLGNGGSSANANTLSGYGGGGNGGGSAGGAPTGSSGSSGGPGGNNHGGTGGGGVGVSNGAGSNGGGGAGGQTGVNGSGGISGSGGDGGNGTEWDGSHGSGGGGGEGCNNTSTTQIGGKGGLYGGGAGANGTQSSATGSSGGQGIIVITGTYIVNSGVSNVFVMT